MTLYHVTTVAALPAILQDGLQPRIGARSAACAEAAPAIYLFPDLPTCEEALANWMGDVFDDTEDLAILAVDLAASAVSHYEVIHHSPIPACRLSVHSTL